MINIFDNNLKRGRKMNTYSKYCPNVFLAKCEEDHKKGDIIEIETRYGKVNEHFIHNLVKKSDTHFFYSITRVDGYNLQKRAEAKADKYRSYAESAESKSNQAYERSNKDKEFLSLGEPIKIGHHSEKRHRKMIENAWNNMDKCVENDKKAKGHSYKAESWEGREKDINLSIPESLEYYQEELEKALEYHKGMKDGTIKKDHSYSLTYAKKAVNDLQKKVNIALIMWKE